MAGFLPRTKVLVWVTCGQGRLNLWPWYILGDPCKGSGIKELRAANRRINYTSDTNRCDFTDPEFNGEWFRWYKVTGDAGNALAAVDTPPSDRCGTKSRVYLKENHPEPSDGEVTRKVCIAKNNNPCQREVNIKVKNCGSFYLYKLARVRDHCSPLTWRYCTNGVGE